MKIIIEQEDVGKEISQLGLMLIEKKQTYELAIQYPSSNLNHILEIQKLQNEEKNLMLISPMSRIMKKKHRRDSEQMAGLSDANSVLLGTTPAGAKVHVKRPYKKRAKK